MYKPSIKILMIYIMELVYLSKGVMLEVRSFNNVLSPYNRDSFSGRNIWQNKAPTRVPKDPQEREIPKWWIGAACVGETKGEPKLVLGAKESPLTFPACEGFKLPPVPWPLLNWLGVLSSGLERPAYSWMALRNWEMIDHNLLNCELANALCNYIFGLFELCLVVWWPSLDMLEREV